MTTDTDTLVARLRALAEGCDKAQEWMRKPDYDDPSLADLAGWLNDRPVYALPESARHLRLAADRIEALEAEVARVKLERSYAQDSLDAAKEEIARLAAERDTFRDSLAVEQSAHSRAIYDAEKAEAGRDTIAAGLIEAVKQAIALREAAPEHGDPSDFYDIIDGQRTAGVIAALDKIKRQAKAEGMREAEGILRAMWASTSAAHSDAILARAANLEASHAE